MNLTAIRAALVNACDEQGLNLYVTAPTSPEFPCLYPAWPSQMYEFSSTSSCCIDIALTLAVSRADEEVAQAALSDIIATGEIIDAIYKASRDYWIDIAFLNISNFRTELFSETMQALAADFNFTLRTK